MSDTDIWVLSAPEDAIASIEVLLASHQLCASWYPQPISQNSFQARITANLAQRDVEDLVCKLAKLCIAFEVSVSGVEPCSFLYHDGLGLRRVALDASGEGVIRFGQLERLMELSQGSNAELKRLLRLASATAWYDLLQPYMTGSSSVELMPRAV